MLSCEKFKKSALDAYSNVSHTYTTGNNVIYDQKYICNGQSICFTSGTAFANIVKSGLYLVMFSADAVATTAGDITMQLYRNGVIVPSAEATVTAANTTDTNNITFHSLVEVSDACCCVGNSRIPLVVTNTGVGVSVTNAKFTVIKLA